MFFLWGICLTYRRSSALVRRYTRPLTACNLKVVEEYKNVAILRPPVTFIMGKHTERQCLDLRGIEGNERADRLEKEGSVLEQIERDLTYREVKSIIKTSLNNKWKENHPEYNKQDGVYCLNRRGQTTIFRLRTGHNRLKYHIHKLFKVGETDLCSCGQAAETAQHVLPDCRLYSNVRQSLWRERVDMHTKLYGLLSELEKMVAFIAQAGIGI